MIIFFVAVYAIYILDLGVCELLANVDAHGYIPGYGVELSAITGSYHLIGITIASIILVVMK